MSTTPHDIRWFKSQPTAAKFDASKIDAEKGIISDVVMVEEGPAKGHDVHLESEFIEDLVKYDLRVFGDRGVKARFGHPGASGNTMGMQMGVYKNIRKRKGPEGQMQAIGDLHLLEASEASPTRPGMRSYVLKMAAEAPDFIMSSIVFSAGRFYQKNKDKSKRYVWESVEDTDEDGNKYYRWVSPDSKLGNVYVEFGDKGQHYFTDLVDQGAATESLFSAEANPQFFVSQAEIFLAEHLHLKTFLQDNPEKVLAFLAQMGVKVPAPQTKTLNMNNLWNFLSGKSNDKPEGVDADLDTLRAEFGEAKTQVTALQTERNDLVKSLATAQDEIKSLGAQIIQLGKDKDTLQARVTELEKEGAAEHTDGDTEVPEVSSAWAANPINQKAQAMRDRRKKK